MKQYFDHNATTPTSTAVLKVMLPFFTEKFANPSSQHQPGRVVAKALQKARQVIAQELKVNASEIIFTAGGSEANNLAIKGVARSLKKKGQHLICSLGEHHSVLNTMRELENDGFDVTYLPAERSGIVKLDALRKAIRKETTLVSIMAVNNETGVVQPMAEIGRIMKNRVALWHVDAVQALGKIPLDLVGWGVDLASFAAHKIYGPKGVGALYAKEGVQLWPIISGGGQEGRRRAGTENVPGIAGFSEAVKLIIRNQEKIWQKQKRNRDYLEKLLQSKFRDMIVNGKNANRVNNTLNFIVPGVNSKLLVSQMSKRGFYLASGAACTAKHFEPSHVLLSMGISAQLALGAVRISLGPGTTKAEISALGNTLEECIKKNIKG